MIANLSNPQWDRLRTLVAEGNPHAVKAATLDRDASALPPYSPTKRFLRRAAERAARRALEGGR